MSAWLAELRRHPAVDMVDDDRDWLRQLELLVAVFRGVGLTLGALLLAAATLTIASVIRLTAYLYRDEIAVLRLIGATEFYIRGPFYAEGLVQEPSAAWRPWADSMPPIASSARRATQPCWARCWWAISCR